jgi:hypothetical protein
MYMLAMLYVQKYISPLKVTNKPCDRKSEHAFILGSVVCTVPNNSRVGHFSHTLSSLHKLFFRLINHSNGINASACVNYIAPVVLRTVRAGFPFLKVLSVCLPIFLYMFFPLETALANKLVLSSF